MRFEIGAYVEHESEVFTPTSGLATGILNLNTGNEYTRAELEAAGDKGHIFFYSNPLNIGRGWLEKFYLLPIPSEELLLNPNLKQQPER